MNRHYPSPFVSMIYLILAQVSVAISIIASKYLVHYMPILVLLTIRFILATVILFVFYLIRSGRNNSIKKNLRRLKRRDWLYLLAQALSAGVFFNALILGGLHYTDANVAGIITSALPALIALLSWIILKETLYYKTIICILFATLGLLIIGYDKLNEVNVHNSILGDVLIFLSLFPEAAYYIFTKIYTSRLPIFFASALISGINAVILIVLSLIIQPSFASITIYNWMILFFLGLTVGLFYAFWFLGCRNVDGVKTSLATAVMPVATVIFAWAILNEHLSGIQLLGMGFVMLSVIVNGF